MNQFIEEKIKEYEYKIINMESAGFEIDYEMKDMTIGFLRQSLTEQEKILAEDYLRERENQINIRVKELIQKQKEKIKLPCLECGKLVECDKKLYEQYDLNVFCDGGECEDKYAFKQ